MTVNYSQIIGNSWKLAWKNKWLWVMGIVASAGSSGGSYSNYSNLFSDSTSKNQQTIEQTQQEGSKVLGQAVGQIQAWFKTIDPAMWGTLILILVALFVIGIVISLILTAFAQGSLIAGVKEASDQKDVNLRVLGRLGRKNLVSLIKFRLLFSLVIFGLFFLPLIFVGLGSALAFASKVVVLQVVFVILISLILIVFIFSIPFTTLTLIFGERKVVFEQIGAWEGIKAGWQMCKKDFWQNLLMGIINTAISAGLGIGTVVVMALVAIPMVLIGVFLSTLTPVLLPIVIFLGVVLFLALIFAGVIFTGFLTVFKHSNWNQFYYEKLSQSI